MQKGHHSQNKLDRSLWYSLSDKYYQEVFGESISPTGEMYISQIINTDNKTKDLKNTNAHASDALECGPNPSDLKSPKQAEPTDEQLQAFREVEGLKFVKGLLC